MCVNCVLTVQFLLHCLTLKVLFLNHTKPITNVSWKYFQYLKGQEMISCLPFRILDSYKVLIYPDTLWLFIGKLPSIFQKMGSRFKSSIPRQKMGPHPPPPKKGYPYQNTTQHWMLHSFSMLNPLKHAQEAQLTINRKKYY